MSRTDLHVHTRKEELCVYWIPADTDIPMQMKTIGNDWREMGKLVEGYIRLVRTEFMPELYCGCRMVMAVNEDGYSQQLPENTRAGIFYPYEPIVGDVFMIGEGLVKSTEGDEEEPDLFSLPQALITWEGPGNPIPQQKQPWEK